MDYVCGGFLIRFSGEFSDYTDLQSHVDELEIPGLILGEDASDYRAFYALEVHKCFANDTFRIGVVLEDHLSTPKFCPVHGKEFLAIGLNDEVVLIDLNTRTSHHRTRLDSFVHHLLCNGDVLAAVHELGAKVLRLSDCKEIADVFCEIVAEAKLSATELVLVSMEEETTRVVLSEVGG